MIQNGVGIVLDPALEASEILAFPDSKKEVFLVTFALFVFGPDSVFSPAFPGTPLRPSLHQSTDKPRLK